MENEVTTERSLGRVEGKIDMILLELVAGRKLNDERHADHDHRLTSLERVRWYAGGAVALAMAFAAKLQFFPH